MPVEIKVPRLGWSMEEGTFVEWLKRDGEFVEAGQPLFAIEGDKAIQDVEAIGSGILRISPRAPESGAPVRVGVTLAFLVTADEVDPFAGPQLAGEPGKPAPDKPATPKPTSPKPTPEVPQPKPSRPEKPGPEVPKPGTAPSKTPPPAVPEPEITPPKSPGPSTPGPEISPPRPSQPEISPAGPPLHEPGSPSFVTRAQASVRRPLDGQQTAVATRPRISPRALRIAAELDLNWRDVPGTGRNGRIRERDVRAAADGTTAKIAPSAYSTTAYAHRAPVSAPAESAARAALRRTIAARMTAGSQQTAPVTLTTTADATNLVSLRAQFKSAAAAASTGDAVTPGYLAFITKLAARALAEHPQLNQQWIDGRIETPAGIHIAVAVDTAAGLLAPVVRDVAALGLRDVAACLADLTKRAESGQLAPADLTGGTFTISNLGAYGIDAFTPILNVPQCAILGLGRIEKRPAVVGDQIVPRDQMVLSLTFDHRIVDGAPAAKFLATLRQGIENPGPWLVS
jgi:pyruvate/2-oxoglutarate dehydrogenase complex dihydrolipoamide acyltransferase (E2) component